MECLVCKRELPRQMIADSEMVDEQAEMYSKLEKAKDAQLHEITKKHPGRAGAV